MKLDSIDAEHRGPMVVRVNDRIAVVPPADAFSWREVVGCIASAPYFAHTAWPLDAHPIEHWQVPLLQEAWVRHNGLPPADQARRLAAMLEKYYDGIEYDFRAKLGLSAGELFRARRWREMLGYLDQFPTDTHYNRLLSRDEEYMERALAGAKESTDPAAGKPSMAEWSLTNSMLATLIDAVNRNTAVNQGIANPKGPRPRIDPQPRPYTAAQRAKWKIEKQKHEEMVSLLLPNKKG